MQIKIFPIITVVVLHAILLSAGIAFFTDSPQTQTTQNQELLEQILNNQRGQSLALALSRNGNNNSSNNQDYKEVEMLFRQTLRDIIKEELSAIRVHDVTIDDDIARAAADKQENDKEKSPEFQKKQQVAFQQTKTIVQDAIHSGFWTTSNRDEMNSRMSTLSKEQQTEIIQQLFGAINSGQLKPESPNSLIF